MSEKRKPIICIDFDGVIHDYRHGWEGSVDKIGGDVVSGFFDWAEKATQHFKLVVYSSRSKERRGVLAMRDWIESKLEKWHDDNGAWIDSGIGLHYRLPLETFEFSAEKPPAFVTIDDRGINFGGDWQADDLQPEALLNFKPWNVK